MSQHKQQWYIGWGNSLPFRAILMFNVVFALVSVSTSAQFSSGQLREQSSQNQNQSVIDSLKALLPFADEAHRVGILNELTVEYFYISLEQSAIHQREALALAQKLDDRKGIAIAILNEGFIARQSSHPILAFDRTSAALAVFRGLGDQQGIARSLYHLGLVYEGRGDFLNARSYFLQALDIAERIADTFLTARLYNAISEDYFQQSDFDKALDYAVRSVALHRKHPDERWLAIQLDNVGFMYEHLKQPQKALEQYLQAYTILTAIKRKGQHRLANSCKNIANAYRSLKNYPEALMWAWRGIEIQRTSFQDRQSLNGMRGNYKALADIFEEQGNIDSALVWNKRILALPSIATPYSVGVIKTIVGLYQKRGDCDAAKAYGRQAWQMAWQFENPKVRETAARVMVDAMAMCGEYDSAYRYQEKYVILHDSSTSIEKGKQIARLQALHDLDKQNQENERLRQENLLKEIVISRQTVTVVVIACSLALALLFTFLLYRANLRNKQTTIRLQSANTELDAALQDLKETQAWLIQSERMSAAGMLTAGVMHEINNPNAAVYAALEQITHKARDIRTFFLSLIDEAGKESPEAKKMTSMTSDIERMSTIALDGSSRIKNIVASLRTFTKHQEDGIKAVSLEKEIASTVEIFRYQFGAVQVQQDYIGTTTIDAKVGEINQVFLNLLVNAAQAGATHILIGALESNDHKSVAVKIQDNGMGIEPEASSRIFEAFFTTKGAGNSGLGLSITKKILDRHGASVHVDSVVGAGTTFTITFLRSLQ